MNFLNGENEDYYNASHRLNKSIAERIFDMSLRFDFAYQFSKKFQQWESDQKLSNNFCHKVIRERRNKLVKSDVDEKVFLDILLEARIDGIPLTNEEICGEVLTFLEAGHTTTAVSISFLLFKMAQYPEVERKLVEEIDSVIGDSNDPIPMETLKEFKYMDLVLQETHRLYPPVPNIARRVLKDFKLSEHIVPAGATIAISQLCLGRRPELFENPEEFIPERFIDKEFHNFAYLPFSAGQR